MSIEINKIKYGCEILVKRGDIHQLRYNLILSENEYAELKRLVAQEDNGIRDALHNPETSSVTKPKPSETITKNYQEAFELGVAGKRITVQTLNMIETGCMFNAILDYLDQHP